MIHAARHQLARASCECLTHPRSWGRVAVPAPQTSTSVERSIQQWQLVRRPAVTANRRTTARWGRSSPHEVLVLPERRRSATIFFPQCQGQAPMLMGTQPLRPRPRLLPPQARAAEWYRCQCGTAMTLALGACIAETGADIERWQQPASTSSRTSSAETRHRCWWLKRLIHCSHRLSQTLVRSWIDTGSPPRTSLPEGLPTMRLGIACAAQRATRSRPGEGTCRHMLPRATFITPVVTGHCRIMSSLPPTARAA